MPFGADQTGSLKIFSTRRWEAYPLSQSPDASLGFGLDAGGRLSWGIHSVTSITYLGLEIKAMQSLRPVDLGENGYV